MNAPWPDYDTTEPCYGRENLFISSPCKDAKAARELCQSCRVYAPCLAWALEREGAGFWGGTSVGERVALRKRFGIKVDLPQKHAQHGQMQHGSDEEPCDEYEVAA